MLDVYNQTEIEKMRKDNYEMQKESLILNNKIRQMSITNNGEK